MKYILIKKYNENTSYYKYFEDGIEIKCESNNKKDCIKVMKDLAFQLYELPEEEEEDYIIFTDFNYEIIKTVEN